MVTHEEYASGIDPANYLLAMDNYSITADRPHPPGYPVYIAMCKAVRLVTPSNHRAILMLITVLSVGSVYLLYKITQHVSTQKTALLAAALLAFNPLFWMYGSVTESYTADAFFSCLLVYSTLTARGRWWIAAGMILGLACGVRSTSPILLSPVILLIAWYRFKSSQLNASHVTLWLIGTVVGLAAWLPWVVWNEGGVANYLAALASLSHNSTGTFVGNVTGFVVFAGWSLNVGAVYVLLRIKHLVNIFRDTSLQTFSLPLILLMWVVPPAVFFLLVLYAKGYLLLFLPALCIGLSLVISSEPTVFRRRLFATVLMVGNMATFLLTPYSIPPIYTTLSTSHRSSEQRAASVIGRTFSVYLPSLSRIHANNRQVGSALDMLGGYLRNAHAQTLVVIDPSARQFIHPRGAQFYFPEYYFVELELEQKGNLYHGIEKSEFSTLESPFPMKHVVLLSQNGMDEFYKVPGLQRIASDNCVTLWEVPAASQRELRTRVYELFVKK